MKNDFRDTLIAQCIVIVVLVFALTGISSSYYLLLHFIICGIFAYLAVNMYQRGKLNWVWIYGALAVLYNPLVPIRLSHNVWPDVYILTIILISFMLWLFFRANKSSQKEVSFASQTGDALASFFGIYVNKKKHDEIAAIRECKCCGKTKLTQMAVFLENISYFYERHERTFEGYVCFSCMTKTYIIYETRTLLFTWWGFFGLALGPCYLLWNLCEYLGRSYRFTTYKKV